METAPLLGRRLDRPFRYEEAWTRHGTYDEMVAQAWEAAGTGEQGLGAVRNTLAIMTGSMQRWAREVFGSIRRQVKKLKVQLLDAKNRALTSGSSLEVRELEEELREIYPGKKSCTGSGLELTGYTRGTKTRVIFRTERPIGREKTR